MLHWSILYLALLGLGEATPTISFPINSQVPPVARIGRPFSYTFASTTFNSDALPIRYSLSAAPPWLQLDSDTQTFFGTPGTSDSGVLDFSLIATDGQGPIYAPVTFIVSNNAGPGLGIPVSQQIGAYGALSGPDTLIYYPSSSFSISFGPDTFTGTSSSTSYYAQCANNTPLPSWMSFNPASLTFTGITPGFTSTIELPQTFMIELTASDVVGFAGAIATFQFTISEHELAFTTEQLAINATSGHSINSTVLQQSLILDGKPMQQGQMQSVLANAPPWVTIDSQSLTLSGTPPATAAPIEFSVSATDQYGDVANATIMIFVGNATNLIQGTIGTLQATSGEYFSYTFDSTLFAIQDTKITVVLGSASAWLSFVGNNMTLQGNVPKGLTRQQLTLSLIASLGTQTAAQDFYITVAPDANPSSNTTEMTASPSGSKSAIPSAASSTSIASVSPTTQPSSFNSTAASNDRKVAEAVVLPIVACLGLGLLILWCVKGRRRRSRERESFLSGWKRSISRPLPFFRDPLEHSNLLSPRPAMRERPSTQHTRITSEPSRLEIRKKRQSGQRSLRRYSIAPSMMSLARRADSNVVLDSSLIADDEVPLRTPETISVHRSRAALAKTPSRGHISNFSRAASGSTYRSIRAMAAGHGVPPIDNPMHAYSRFSHQSKPLSEISHHAGLGHGRNGNTWIPGSPPIESVPSDDWTTVKESTSASNSNKSTYSFPRPPTSHGRTVSTLSPIPDKEIAEETAKTKSTIRLVQVSLDRDNFIHRRSQNHSPSPLFAAAASARQTSGNAAHHFPIKSRGVEDRYADAIDDSSPSHYSRGFQTSSPLAVASSPAPPFAASSSSYLTQPPTPPCPLHGKPASPPSQSSPSTRTGKKAEPLQSGNRLIRAMRSFGWSNTNLRAAALLPVPPSPLSSGGMVSDSGEEEYISTESESSSDDDGEEADADAMRYFGDQVEAGRREDIGAASGSAVGAEAQQRLMHAELERHPNPLGWNKRSSFRASLSRALGWGVGGQEDVGGSGSSAWDWERGRETERLRGHVGDGLALGKAIGNGNRDNTNGLETVTVGDARRRSVLSHVLESPFGNGTRSGSDNGEKALV
ncbi:hypothetical protein MMC25_008324 [Agyrium rufum]|nr:hypothetical protein [Agyrium rufum]